MGAWAGVKVLVTGATGTVGSAVVARLTAEGARVRAMGRHDGVAGAHETAVADLGEVASLRRAVDGCDVVVHCAAAVSVDVAACRAGNVDGVRNLMSALAAAPRARLVHVSTASVYDWRRGMDFDEESPQWPASDLTVDPYGVTKAESERLVRASDVPWTIVRPVMVLSTHPRSYWGPLALERARATGQSPMPLATVPYVHVDNLAAAIALAATSERALGRAYDVIDGEGDAAEYVAAVFAALGRTPPAPNPSAPRMRIAGRRVREELGWTPVDRWREFLDALAALRASGS